MISKQSVQIEIEKLRAIQSGLIPQSEIVQAMLRDAIEGDIHGGIHGHIQLDLLKLLKAIQQVESAIETLESIKG